MNTEQPTCKVCGFLEGNPLHHLSEQWEGTHPFERVDQPSTPPSKISGGALHVEDDLIPPTVGSTPPSPVEAKVQSAEEANDKFWSWCEENAVNGAMRIDENWRVDDVAIAYASSLTAEKDAKIAVQAEEIAELKSRLGGGVGNEPRL